MTRLSFSKAVNKALADAMAADDRVILLGEDIGNAGGSFAATRTLKDRFGADRVLDTPISEAAIAGAAVGAALSGLKPIVEIMFMDFSTLVMDALVNQAAKARFMFGGRTSVPMVLRMPHGGGLGAGPQHSQCLEAWFAHVPGLKVVCPADAEAAYRLLRAAIDDPDPVIFIENKALYGSKAELPDDAPPARLGEARIIRAGCDATIVTYGASVHVCTKAAAELAGQGIEVCIVDLQSLQPWDEATVLASVRETGRLVIVHEATESFGPGAEVAARTASAAFGALRAPILRVAAPFTPVPFSPALEAVYMPSADAVVRAVRRAFSYPSQEVAL